MGGGGIMEGGGGSHKGRDYLATCYNGTTHTQPLLAGCLGWWNKARDSHPSSHILCQLANEDDKSQLSAAEPPGSPNYGSLFPLIMDSDIVCPL